jgi:hypothetical protein
VRRLVSHLIKRTMLRSPASCLAGWTYSNGNVDVLGEHNALRLDDEEVNKLLDIVGHALKRGLRDGEVLARPELRGKATSESRLSDNLRSGGSTEDHVGGLEDVADQVQVPCGEDEDDRGSEGDAGGAGVLPAQQAVEQAVVVCSWLATYHGVCPSATYG